MTNNMKNYKKEIFQYALAGLVVIGFFAVIITLIVMPIPKENKDALNILLGFLGGSGFALVLTYFFSSTKGSADKTKIIAHTNAIDRDIIE
jgi:uncharacterized protein YhhL (DUF1145 family)